MSESFIHRKSDRATGNACLENHDGIGMGDVSKGLQRFLTRKADFPDPRANSATLSQTSTTDLARPQSTTDASAGSSISKRKAGSHPHRSQSGDPRDSSPTNASTYNYSRITHIIATRTMSRTVPIITASKRFHGRNLAADRILRRRGRRDHE